MGERVGEKKMPAEENAHIVRSKTDSEGRKHESAIAGLDMLKIY